MERADRPTTDEGEGALAELGPTETEASEWPNRLEASHRVTESFAARLRDGSVVDGDEAYRAGLAWLTRRAAERMGIDIDDMLSDVGRTPAGALESAWRAAAEEAGVEPGEALEEPHLLGWFHEHWGEPERAASHRAHTSEERKHESATVAAQLYTPRWIADVLVVAALDAADGAEPELLDPAVGGGQMLLAGFDAMRRRGAGVEEAIRRLRGVDLDARAVEVARRSLVLRAAPASSDVSPDRIASIVERNVRAGDGLFDSLDGADTVVTNPPYMGLRSMPADLKSRVREKYEPFHGDLYAAFIDRCRRLARESVGLLAQQTIWYLKRFRRAREQLLEEGQLELFVHLGPGAFRSLSGEKANVVAFVQSAREGSRPTTFVDVRDIDEAAAMRRRVAGAIAGAAGGASSYFEGDAYRRSTASFRVLPDQPVAHWLPEALRRHFEHDRRLADVAEVPGRQLKTADNRRFVREWGDVPAGRRFDRPMELSPEEVDGEQARPADERWIFYSKGGGFAPWWGNWQSVVDWSEEAREYYRTNSTSNLMPEVYRFREGICYTDFGGQTFNARWMPPGCLFDMAGPAIFALECERPRRRLFALLALLNSAPVRVLLNAMNPSIHYQVGDLRRLPLPELSGEDVDALADLGRRLVGLARQVARRVEASPVGGVGNKSAGAVASDMQAARDRAERMVAELYGWAPPEQAPGRRHRYLELAAPPRES